MEKISIIIPVYNAEKYIAETIESVLRQTYSNIELLLVDDGSKDDSGKICLKYAASDTRVKYIHKANGGVSSARNRGLIEVTGEYIGFMDADDIAEADMYEIMMTDMHKYRADVVSIGAGIYENEKLTGAFYGTNKLTVMNREEVLVALLSLRVINKGVWSKIFKRELVEGILYDESRSMYEDIYYIFEAFSRANCVVNHDILKYRYMRRENSITTSKFNQKWFDTEYFTSKIKKESCKFGERVYRQAVFYDTLNALTMIKYMQKDSVVKEWSKEYKKLRKTIRENAGCIKYSEWFNKKQLLQLNCIMHTPWLYRWMCLFINK